MSRNRGGVFVGSGVKLGCEAPESRVPLRRPNAGFIRQPFLHTHILANFAKTSPIWFWRRPAGESLHPHVNRKGERNLTIEPISCRIIHIRKEMTLCFPQNPARGEIFIATTDPIALSFFVFPSASPSNTRRRGRGEKRKKNSAAGRISTNISPLAGFGNPRTDHSLLAALKRDRTVVENKQPRAGGLEF